MRRNVLGGSLVLLVGITFLAALPATADAQYRCAVAIEIKGKPVLQAQIRDVERPPTDELWDLLKSLSFSPTKDGKDLPDPTTNEQTTLKGDLRVTINGAGNVELTELRLVRNKLSTSAWVIAPADVTRILKMRKTAEDKQPKK